jgi:hypothetical protein
MIMIDYYASYRVPTKAHAPISALTSDFQFSLFFQYQKLKKTLNGDLNLRHLPKAAHAS